jgi:hypothetical protein
MIGCKVSISYLGKNSSVDIENAVRQAWKATRRDFPNIAAVVEPNTEELVVRLGPDDKEEAWLRKSFQVHDDGITADELFASFSSQFCITLHLLRHANELVIQAPHALIDGRGILYLYDALFTALSKQPQSLQENHYHSNGTLDTKTRPPNLTKPYDEWLGVSAQPSEKNIKDAEMLFQRIFVQDKPIALPGVDFARAPWKAVHRDLVFSEEITAAVIEACKREGVSVTSAWHAALAMAVQVSLISFQSLPLTIPDGVRGYFIVNILSESFMPPFVFM